MPLPADIYTIFLQQSRNLWRKMDFPSFAIWWDMELEDGFTRSRKYRNFKPRFGHGPVLKPGMTLAIEPMVNAGDWPVWFLDDGWTVVTQDGENSAHYENTIYIRKDGEPEILSL